VEEVYLLFLFYELEVGEDAGLQVVVQDFEVNNYTNEIN
jgi:hypothetical protein